MSNIDHAQPDLQRGPTPTQGLIIPQGRVSAPEFVDWHLVQDHEIDMLSNSEATFVGTIGWCALGAALGNAPAFVAALSRIPDGLSGADLTAGTIFVGSAVAAVICLSIFWSQRKRYAGLPDTVRQRGGVGNLIRETHGRVDG